MSVGNTSQMRSCRQPSRHSCVAEPELGEHFKVLADSRMTSIADRNPRQHSHTSLLRSPGTRPCGLLTAAQTERIIRALDNRYLSILGHPTGRLIGERDPSALDIERVITAARERGCFLEINSQPERLDLNDIHVQMAKDKGVKLAISTDARSIDTLGYTRFGIDQARRGWLTRDDVINTRSLAALRKLSKR
jgi:hypothetical protein